jgi:acyl dehydratase
MSSDGRFCLKPCPARVDEDAAWLMANITAEVLGTSLPSAPTIVPFIYPMRLVAHAAAEIKGHLRRSGGLIAVHESQSIKAVRALRVGEELMLAGEFEVAGDAASLALNAKDSGHETVVETVSRLRFSTAVALLGRGSIVGARLAENATLPPILSKPLTDCLVAAYAEASGDANPIHTDLRLTTSLGLPERVVHGMLVVGLAEPAMAATGFGRLMELRIRFLAPVFVGERVSVTVADMPVTASCVRRVRVVVKRHEGGVACVSDAVVAG